MFKQLLNFTFLRSKKSLYSVICSVMMLPNKEMKFKKISTEELDGEKLRKFFKDGTYLLSFNGTEKELLGLLFRCIKNEKLFLNRWRVFYGQDKKKIVQVKFKEGKKEFGRFVKIL